MLLSTTIIAVYDNQYIFPVDFNENTNVQTLFQTLASKCRQINE
jgi:hypothetical protein